MTFTDNDLIYSYSRAQAIADGVLVDVTDTAHEVGFRIPVALTSTLWARIDTIPENSGEDPTGRLCDVLSMLLLSIRSMPHDQEILHFSVLMTDAETMQREHLNLKAICGPGDDAEPVLTILLPNED